MNRFDIITFHTFHLKKYHGLALRILFIKVEVIHFKGKFNLKLEISNW